MAHPVYVKRALRDSEAVKKVSVRRAVPGRCTTRFSDLKECFMYFFAPIKRLQTSVLLAKNKGYLVDYIDRFAMFRLGLGMLRCRRIDDLYDNTAIGYNAYMAHLLPRNVYYEMNGAMNVDVTKLIVDVNAAWGQVWKFGDAATGDEAIVPTTSKKAKPFRQYIPRKPHSTGLKLYVLSDGGAAFVYHVYFFRGTEGRLHNESATQAVGAFAPPQIVQLWGDLLPVNTMLIADSFFGSHAIARGLQNRTIPFILLTKRNSWGVRVTARGLRAGGLAAIVLKERYSLVTFKNPQVGHKPCRVVPFLTNCVFSPTMVPHRRGYSLPAVVGAYRALAGGVDLCNHLALQHREVGRFRSWAKALRAFIFRYCIVNAFTVSRQQGLIPPQYPMFSFQWALMRRIFSGPINNPINNPIDRTIIPPNVHCPTLFATRNPCAHCGKGRMKSGCAQCQKHFHFDTCFAAYHGH